MGKGNTLGEGENMTFRKGLLAIVGIMCCVAAVRAEVRVSERSPNAKVWRKLYAAIPEKWQTDREIVVEEVSGAELRRIAAESEDTEPQDEESDETDIDGCYQNSGVKEPIRIFIRETLRGETAELVFLHEYAHFIWDEFVTPDEQELYTKVWREQRRSKRLVTEYAATSVEEGFADSLSYALRKSKYLKQRDPRSARFMERLME